MDFNETPQEFLLNLKTNPHEDHILSDKLGEGSFGVVWKATNTKTKKVYAMKVVPISDDLDSLVSEIKIMKQSECPFVIKQYDTFIKDEKLWILMEYCGPGSLADIMLLTGKGLREDQISMICRCVLKGLAYLHSVNIIHRDVKAGNILISDNMSAKLTDFGVSGKVENKKVKRMSVKGSPYWMAPEVIQEVGYTYKADIWSLGITAIELAEIHPPNYDIPPERFIFMIPSRPPPALKDPQKYKKEINDFLTKCLNKDPTQRLESWELLDHAFVQNTKSVLVLEDLLEDMNKVIESCGGREKAFQKAEEKLERESKSSSGEVEEEKGESSAMDDIDDDDIDLMAEFNEDDIFSGSESSEEKDEEASENKGKGTYKPLFMQYLENNPHEDVSLAEKEIDEGDNLSRSRGSTSTFSTLSKVDDSGAKCKTCGLKLIGMVLKALNHQYHPNCFKCIVCNVMLQNVNFFEKHEFPYCKAHNTLLFGHICFKCGQEIEPTQLVYEMDKYWHREHFACIVCGVKSSTNNLYRYDQKPYCKDHYKEKTKSFCSWCEGEFKDDNFITVHEQTWHPTCFYQSISQGKEKKTSADSSSPDLETDKLNGTKSRSSHPNIMYVRNKNTSQFSSSTPSLTQSPLFPKTPPKGDNMSTNGSGEKIGNKKVVVKKIVRKVVSSKKISVGIISPEPKISLQRYSMREVSSNKSSDDPLSLGLEDSPIDLQRMIDPLKKEKATKIHFSTNNTNFTKLDQPSKEDSPSEKKSSIFINQKSRISVMVGKDDPKRKSSRSTIVMNSSSLNPTEDVPPNKIDSPTKTTLETNNKPLENKRLQNMKLQNISKSEIKKTIETPIPTKTGVSLDKISSNNNPTFTSNSKNSNSHLFNNSSPGIISPSNSSPSNSPNNSPTKSSPIKTSLTSNKTKITETNINIKNGNKDNFNITSIEENNIININLIKNGNLSKSPRNCPSPPRSPKSQRSRSNAIITPSPNEPQDRLYAFLKLIAKTDKYEKLKEAKFITPESLYSLRDADLINCNILNKKDRNNFLRIINTQLPKFIKNNPPKVEVNEERQRTKSKIEAMQKMLIQQNTENEQPTKQLKRFCIKCGNKLSDVVCEKCGTKNTGLKKKINKLN